MSTAWTSLTDLNNCTRWRSTVECSNSYWEKDSMHDYYSPTTRMNGYRWFVSVVCSMASVSLHRDSLLWQSVSHSEDLHRTRARTLFLLHRYKLDGCAHPCHACTMDTRFLHLRSRRRLRPDLVDQHDQARRDRWQSLPIHIVKMAGRYRWSGREDRSAINLNTASCRFLVCKHR